MAILYGPVPININVINQVLDNALLQVAGTQSKSKEKLFL